MQSFVNFLRNILHAIWVFFPGILFLVLTQICFWNLSQGKDLMVLATEQEYFFLLFLLLLSFLVLVSWYGARLVADAKQKGELPDAAYLADGYYKHMPRFIGFSFFTSILLAFMQTPLFSPVVIFKWDKGFYYILLALSIPYYFLLSNFFERRFKVIRLNRLFWITMAIIVGGSALVTLNIRKYVGLVFVVLLVLQAGYLVLVITRREKLLRKGMEKAPARMGIAQKIADAAGLPASEVNFHFVFLLISLGAAIIYIS